MLRKVTKDPLSGDNSSSSTTSAHMCLSFNKTNRIRLIVGSSDIRYSYQIFFILLMLVFFNAKLLFEENVFHVFIVKRKS